MKNYSFLILIFLSMLLMSCGSEDKNISEPETSANIIGSVNLYDESINKVDNSGMSVRIEGLAHNNMTLTDAEGNFTFEDVPFGKYNLVYEKSGYGTYKLFDLEHSNTGNSTVIEEAKSLGQISSTSVTNLTVNASENQITIEVTTDPVANIGNTKYIRFFFSSQPNVSSENYDSVMETLIVQITPYALYLDAQSFDELGYQGGETVYVKCYGESFWGNNYTDQELGREIFPNVNPNSAIAASFIVP